jgi:hypothetical protein
MGNFSRAEEGWLLEILPRQQTHTRTILGKQEICSSCEKESFGCNQIYEGF